MRLIDADALSEKLCKTTVFIKDGEVFQRMINDAPTVSAEAVQGEWIHDGQNFKGGLDWCHCSECGYKTSANGLSVYRYCPNCGARMMAKGGDSE